MKQPKAPRFKPAMMCHHCEKQISVIGGKFSPHQDEPGHRCLGSGSIPQHDYEARKLNSSLAIWRAKYL